MGRMMEWIEIAVWSLTRWMRCLSRLLGWGGLIVIAMMTVSAALMGLYLHVAANYAEIKSGQTERELTPVFEQVVETDASRLALFRRTLGSPDDIPDLIKDLMSLGEASGLRLTKGEYQQEVDMQGGFLRYHITLPVEGDSGSVMNFVVSAVKKHRNLALEALKIQRERKDMAQIAAQIHLVLLTRLPGDMVDRVDIRRTSGGAAL